MALRFSTGLRNKLLGINPNKIINGSFSSNVDGWTAVNATLSSVSGGQSGNCLQIANSGANYGKCYQDVTTKVGHLYMLQVYFKKGTASGGKVMIGTTSAEDAIFDSGVLTNTSWGLVKVPAQAEIVFAATETTTRITFANTSNEDTYTSLWDEVKLISVARSLQDIFYKSFIRFYTGTQPTLADNAASGTHLVTIYSDGSSEGLSFDDASNAVLSKKATETWSGTAVATGTAGWFRLYTPGDTLAASTTDERIDGAIATAGAELNMASTNIVASSVISINTFQIELAANQ